MYGHSHHLREHHAVPYGSASIKRGRSRVLPGVASQKICITKEGTLSSARALLPLRAPPRAPRRALGEDPRGLEREGWGGKGGACKRSGEARGTRS